MPTKTCLSCADSFDVVESRVGEAKFCSRECYHNGQKEGLTSHNERRVDYVKVECEGCGDIVEKAPSRANRSDRQFCSQECYLDWNKRHQQNNVGRRQRMREKEQASCEICGFDRFLEMSHIVASKDGGTYHKNNIAFLCPNHHRLLDHGKIRMSEITEIEGKIREAVCDGNGWKEP